MNTIEWLNSLSPVKIEFGPFPLREVLENSLFYPSSGFDGDPVRHFRNLFQSYVYVDYGQTESQLEHALQRGFTGYRLLAERSVSKLDLSPTPWRPLFIEKSEARRAVSVSREWAKAGRNAFAKWMVFEREEGRSADHGPPRLSLLFMNADGVAAFQALYLAQEIAPKGIAVIQPGHAFGGNWTDFTNPSEILYRSVSANRAGMPRYLVYGGIAVPKREGRMPNLADSVYAEPCWPEYSKHSGFFKKYDESSRFISKRDVDGVVGLWERNSSSE
jgi:hypothetical protein